MLKSFFILLFSFSLLFANENIQKGDVEFAKQNYAEAIKYYEKAYEQKDKKAKIKLILTYMKLGDNYLRVQSFLRSKENYEKAKELGSRLAVMKLSKVYENIGDLYKKGKKYQEAHEAYGLSLDFGNKEVKDKLDEVKNILSHYEKLKNGDSRKIVDYDSPSWTKAIGRLIVPTKLDITNNGYLVKQKKCSATLVNFSDIQSSKVIVTASHCLSDYDKEAGVIRFLIKDKQGEIIQKYAKVVVDSFYDEKNTDAASDYAVLVLSSSIDKSQVEPLLIPTQSFLEIKKSAPYVYGSMAGFSSDIGEYGSDLTFDPKCEFDYFSKIYGKSSCTAFKGASGGPAVINVSSDNENFQAFFVGVVSHFRDGDFNSLYFSPHHIFLKHLASAVRKYNLITPPINNVK